MSKYSLKEYYKKLLKEEIVSIQRFNKKNKKGETIDFSQTWDIQFSSDDKKFKVRVLLM